MSPGTFEQPVVEEVLDVRAAQPLDVEAVARHEVAQPLDLLERAFEPARAAPHHAALLALTSVLSGQGNAWGMILLASLRPLLGHEAQDLRDHVAGALDRSPCRRPARPSRSISSALCRRGARHHDAADIDRLELGDRGQRAGAADLDVMPFSRVRACSAGNLWAIAQRGARLTKPSRSCQSMRSTL